MKIKIIADSSSGIEYAPFKSNITLIPTMIYFGNEEFVDGIDIKADEFYNKLENTNIIPTTAAPNLGNMINILKNLKLEGYTDVIHFPISGELSNYSINLKRIIDSYDLGINFYVFDSKNACLMQGIVAKYAEVLAELNYDVPKIIIECQKLSKQINTYFLVEDLKYLITNGRLNKFSGTIGTLAKIKPILHINEQGFIVPYVKVRTFSKAKQRTLDIVLKDCSKTKENIIIILHTNRYSEAIELKEMLMSKNKKIENYIITTITPTVGAHIGSGVLGVACIGLDQLSVNLIPYLKGE